jgi:dTMP kinase
MPDKQGKYIVIEGHDGTGKSTQVSIIRERLGLHGIESVEFHEPEGTPMANAIRTLVKNGSIERGSITNLLLFSAARHEIWHGRALPSLRMGKWVVASRNYYSTLAYQGYGEGVDPTLIEKLTLLSTDQQYMNPDLSVVLDLDDENERLNRISSRGKLNNPDSFESRSHDFQSVVRGAYLSIAKSRGITVLSASRPVNDIADDIWSLMQPSL